VAGDAADTIAVVGAGLAGLAAAWELQQRGRRVTLLEREAAVGGRAWSECVDGFTLEPLSPVLSTADAELLAWCARLCVQDDLLPLRPLVTLQVSGRRTAEIDPRGVLDLARIPGVSAREALRLLRLPRLLRRYRAQLDAAEPERAAPLDDRSLADFARLYFGQSVLDRWMGPLLTSACLGDERDASRAHFLRRYVRELGARRGLPRAPLRELCEAAASRLPTLLRARVVGIEPGAGGGLRVSYTREGRERILEASGVVLATDAPTAARLGAAALRTGERELLAGVRYAASVVLAVATCRPLTPQPREVRVPHVEGSPLETALYEPGLPGGRVPDHYGCVTLRATAAWSGEAMSLPDETLEKELLDALEQFEPGARAKVEFTRLYRVERALPRFDVGHYRALARLQRIEADRLRDGPHVTLAGDYRSDPSWAGAFAAGTRAARSLDAALARGPA
jgi:protoporphyrinogen oxidase